jgi:putative membrane protein
MDDYIPFCGLPPAPAELASRWTLDPALLAGLAAALALGLRRADNRRRLAAGWTLAAFLFVTPLCALSMALFSARVAQHLALTLVAAPLIAAALPRLALPPLATAAAFAALFWVWHAPGPYAATLASDGVYWAMHLSLFGGALALWSSVIAAREPAPFAAFLALAGTAGQMSLFAALLVLSPAPWHVWHTEGAALWGLTALGDQALAGAMMWIFGAGLMGVAVAALLTAPVLRRGFGPPGVPAREQARGTAD